MEEKRWKGGRDDGRKKRRERGGKGWRKGGTWEEKKEGKEIFKRFLSLGEIKSWFISHG